MLIVVYIYVCIYACKINTAINQLLEVENEKEQVNSADLSIIEYDLCRNLLYVLVQGVITEDSLAVGMARLGQPSQMVG